MTGIVDEHAEELAALARRYGVARLRLFGPAASGECDPETSDLDFLVEALCAGPIDESQRQLLGQRRDGTFLWHVEKRMDRQPALR